MISNLKTIFRSLASLKVAIPLLVILTVVTVIGSLFPQPDLFWTKWYLALMAILGLSLLLITIQHIPSILRRKGRNALIGVVATHAGILVLIAATIYGGMTGFRYKVRAIEGEMTVVPGLDFVVRLDRLDVEEYPDEVFSHMNLEQLPRKRQDSNITLFRQGEAFLQGVASPGIPLRFDGVTLLPAVTEIGWCFELLITDPMRREKTVPVRPWAPPLVHVGELSVMTHSVMEQAGWSAQVFTIEDDQMKPLGFVTPDVPLELNGHTIRLGAFKRYTGLSIYNRPQTPMLVLGTLLMMAGLVWHFYHRHRDRRAEGKTDD